MDDVCHFKAVAADVPNSLNLLRQGVSIGVCTKLALNVRENAVTDAFADIERLSLAWVD